MKPYYEDDFATIFHGDGVELYPFIECDVVATDPPYGTGYYSTDTPCFTADVLRELVETSKAAAVFGYPEALVALCVDARVKPSEWITWWPTNAGIKSPPNKSGLVRESEHIAVFGEAPGFADLKVLRTRPLHDWKGPKQRGNSNGDIFTRFASDVWTHKAPGIGPGGAHLRKHPNEKPVPVMNMIITGLAGSSRPVVLDPFMGSGSTLVAAKQLGLRCVGIEIEERYCEIAAKRLAQEVLDFGGMA